MKPKLTTPLLASIGAMVMVSTLFLSFYISTSAYRAESTEIVLPSEDESTPVADTPIQQVDDGINGVKITLDNVQQVIASLARPSAYSFTVQNTIYYGQKSSTVSRRQTVRDGVCRTDELSASGGILRSTIRSGNNVYAWQTGSSAYYKGAVGSFSDDAAGMMPTYETVVSLPKDTLSEIGSANLDYELCIVVGARDDDSHRSVYYISTVTGLLKRADIFEGERLIRQCRMTSISTSEPDTSIFTLPDGTLVEGINQTEGIN
ncbi:MAG: hypothetical protein AB7C89_03015 [Intestinibacillus sp.]